jgi:predicted DNA binding CopG/RHH family protein
MRRSERRLYDEAKGLERSSEDRRDLQVGEFEKRDLGDDIRPAGGLRAIRKTLPTSIVVEQDLIDKLRKKAAKRGLGYQKTLKVIVREHVDDY